MISEWMKIMLEEIARKKADAEGAEAEQLLRSQERCDEAKADARNSGERARKA
jgi:hypothetical protein